MSFGGQVPHPAFPKVEASYSPQLKESSMPIILWLLGVPLSIVLLLLLFGVL
ncbi:hypothetical protein [Pulveribacter suum]|uniref:hypothetical protein n=1 Tax=Pulveribacter suum TaxID=2116657 RepID=UPI001300486F|nr:hypothetical protein [Pulveribacter suum]